MVILTIDHQEKQKQALIKMTWVQIKLNKQSIWNWLAMLCIYKKVKWQVIILWASQSFHQDFSKGWREKLTLLRSLEAFSRIRKWISSSHLCLFKRISIWLRLRCKDLLSNFKLKNWKPFFLRVGNFLFLTQTESFMFYILLLLI